MRCQHPTGPRGAGTVRLMPKNPFATEDAAEFYAAGRPDYSRFVTEITRQLTSISGKVPVAVDVGSGTGISTMALPPLAESVIGVEPSSAMVDRAVQAPNVEYRIGTAEDLPVQTDSCDLVGVGSALHWFDQSLFLAEASRIARPDAWLVVHDNFFTAEMAGNDGFRDWFREVYLKRYPPPPRDRSWRPPDHLGVWKHVAWERYRHEVPFDARHLAAYLLTQSNLQAVIQTGSQTPEELEAWLLAETASFFSDSTGSFVFEGFVACHRRSPDFGDRRA